MNQATFNEEVKRRIEPRGSIGFINDVVYRTTSLSSNRNHKNELQSTGHVDIISSAGQASLNLLYTYV